MTTHVRSSMYTCKATSVDTKTADNACNTVDAKSLIYSNSLNI